MKTLAFDRQPTEPLQQSPSRLELIADSAIVMPRHPVFLPDFARAWECRVFVAYRISRLGKSIQSRFAPRYYDAVTLAAVLRPADDAPAVPLFYDFALTLGTWQPLPAEGSPLTVEAGRRQLSLTPGMTEIDAMTEMVSQMATLKTGDILMPCRVDAFEVEPLSVYEASLGGDVCLKMKFR